jgi:energy-coupling factor transporter ATP-binding protein EcfA2
MPYPQELLYSDVAQIQHRTAYVFGSGRLIGSNLVLTARHVVRPPDLPTLDEQQWSVRLRGDRYGHSEQESWDWIDACVEWVGGASLDLALLKLRPPIRRGDIQPKLKLRIAKLDFVQHHPVRGLGFPRGAKQEGKRIFFAPTGTLDDETESTLTFGVDQQYQPESPDEDWRGFSGSAIVLDDSPDQDLVWIYGVAQHVPPQFKRQIAVARLSAAWDDIEFRKAIQDSGIPCIEPADPLAQPHASSLKWEDLAEIGRRVTNDQLKLLRFQRTQFVSRSEIKKQVDLFLESDKPVLAVVGQTGTGKSTFLASLATTLSASHATILVLAYRLRKTDDSLQNSVYRELRRFRPEISEEWLNDLNKGIPSTSEPVILVDGLNEWPDNPESAGRWLASSSEWIRENRLRLIVSCRPEYWELIRGSVDPELFYVQGPDKRLEDRTSRTGSNRFVQVADFTREEAQEAGALYKLSFPGDEPIFNHPFLFRIQSELPQSDSTAKSGVYELFEAYVDSVLARVRAKSSNPVSKLQLRSKCELVAAHMRQTKQLWIDQQEFFEIFDGLESTADALLDEHLLSAGDRNLRFTFDEIPYYLIAASAPKDIETALLDDGWRRIRDDDPILWQALPLLLCKLERQNKSTLVENVLHNMSTSVHGTYKFETMLEHQVFLRSVHWLPQPSRYYEIIRTFAHNCARGTEGFDVEGHPLLPLCDLPGFTHAQRYALLLEIAQREEYGWRWKDWERISAEEFWGERYKVGEEFKAFVSREISEQGQEAISAFASWICNPTRLSEDSEARIGDLASAVLYHSGAAWVKPIANQLFRVIAGGGACSNPYNLLSLLASTYTLEVMKVLDEWSADVERPYNEIISKTASDVLSSRQITPELVERVAVTLDRFLTRYPSDVEVCSFLTPLSMVPSRISRVFEMAEELSGNSSLTLSSAVVSNMFRSDAARTFGLFRRIVETDKNQQNRLKALEAITSSTFTSDVALQLLELLTGYWNKYPDLRSGDAYGGGLGYVTEHVINEIDVDDGNEVKIQAVLALIWRIADASERRPIIHSLLSRSARGGVALDNLRLVVDSEADESNLYLLLERVPTLEIPSEQCFLLIRTIAEKIRSRTYVDKLLIAALKSGNFATLLAERLDELPKEQAAELIKLKEALRSGKSVREAAKELLLARMSSPSN